MSRFFVGQRVRIVRTDKRPEEMGRECRIASIGRDWYEADTWSYLGEMIELDFCINGLPALVLAEQIEPILPEGAAPSEFQTLHDLLTSLEGVAA